MPRRNRKVKNIESAESIPYNHNNSTDSLSQSNIINEESITIINYEKTTQSEINTLRSQLDELNNKLIANETILKERDCDNINLKNTINELQSKNDNFVKVNEKLFEKITDDNNIIQLLKEQNNKQFETINELQLNNNILSNTIENNKVNIKTKMDEFNTLYEKVNSLEQNITELTLDNLKLNDHIKTKELVYNEREEELRIAKELIIKFERRIIELKSKLDNIDHIVGMAEINIKEKDKEIGKLNKKLNSLFINIDDIVDIFDQSRTPLKGKLNKLKHMINELSLMKLRDTDS